MNTADDNPIIGTRSFGADPALVARHAAAAVAGLQAAGVAACAKHFPGHGATVADSHLELPTVDAPLDVLRDRDLPPFAAAVAAGDQAIMTAHIRVPALTGDEPATFSRAGADRPAARRVRLRRRDHHRRAGDEGRQRWPPAGSPAAAVLALAAGADLLCIGAQVDEALVEAIAAEIVAAVQAGDLPKRRLEEAAARVDRLAATASAPVAGVAPAELGLDAARRALLVDGELPDLRHRLVVQLVSPSTIAVGAVPWGLDGYLNGSTAVRVTVGVGDAATEAELPGLDGRPVVVVTRDTHRYAWAQDFIERLVARHPAVVVEMGWPAWRPAGARAYLATYGAGRSNARAAAEALLAARG